MDGRRRAAQATVPEAVQNDEVNQVHHAKHDYNHAEFPAEVLGHGEATLWGRPVERKSSMKPKFTR